MALDRSWYDTLKNDSGQGLDGSVWRKEDVDALMDAIDAELARIDSQAAGNFHDVPFDPANFVVAMNSNGGIWTVEPADQITYIWAVSNQVMWVWLYLDKTSVISTPTTNILQIKIPGGYQAARRVQSFAFGLDNGIEVSVTTRVTPAGSGWIVPPDYIELVREDDQPWANSDHNTYLRVLMSFAILVP